MDVSNARNGISRYYIPKSSMSRLVGLLHTARLHVHTAFKCDEKHPICSNCSTSERPCKYVGKTKRVVANEAQPASITSAQTSATNNDDYPHQVDSQSPVNMLHIELLQFFNTATLESLKAHNEDLALSLTDILQLSLSAPYLMNQVLALAALHLSHVRLSEQKFYYLQATQLQTHAVSIFNNMCPEVTSENCLQMFLFSAVLGTHVLCDALTYRHDDDLNTLLDRFVRYIPLHRGLRVVTRPAITSLNDSTLRQMLTNHTLNPTSEVVIRGELAKLLSLIERAKLGTSLTKTYRMAIECLQSVIDGAKDGCKPTPSTIIAWPALVPLEYVDSLALHRPEAIVILAHYAALLHLHHELWIFQDGGRFLIESITQYLGSDWAEWLRWPNRELCD
ncbi:hypothetical protein UA08_08076 [Talaromyces atroroseus]|uniref:Zn(2)-C6 fungal-type domain-containing protein n=1 Tax=Talaromyces atroroseus TaxID=1441469 RepID=A0A225A726_TALAT|nr:hypothetical protein UA08_08076 [Talaromyces atroroseus]OKL56401.1 hypothetical protein UA08_08076 [Talaromyces atroroseus]